MARENGIAGRGEERTPLLQEQRGEGSEIGSEETLAERRSDEDEEAADENDDKANQLVGRGRGLLIVLSLWGLIFLQGILLSKTIERTLVTNESYTASNISIITTTQSKIVADLDAFASANWFTSTYLIAMSSMSPIAARLAQIFSPRSCIIVASVLFSIGGVLTSQADSLATFLTGRAVSGVGGAGIMTISFILVLELSGKKKRGLYIGLINTGFTTGVSLGAVIAGALLPVTGWVRLSFSKLRICVDPSTETSFWPTIPSRLDIWHWHIFQHS